jgi:hypothetical protein
MARLVDGQLQARIHSGYREQPKKVFPLDFRSTISPQPGALHARALELDVLAVRVSPRRIHRSVVFDRQLSVAYRHFRQAECLLDFQRIGLLTIFLVFIRDSGTAINSPVCPRFRTWRAFFAADFSTSGVSETLCIFDLARVLAFRVAEQP